MKGRERILKTFKGQKTDRIPICPFMWHNAVYKYFDIPPEDQEWRECIDQDYAKKAIEVSEYFGFDKLLRLSSPRQAYIDKQSIDGKWIVKKDFRLSNGKGTEITTIRTPEKTLRQVKEFIQISKYTNVEAIKEYFIKDKSDFVQFEKYQPAFNSSIYPAILDEFKNLEIAKNALGEDGVVVGLIFGGAFNNLNKYRKLEDIIIDPYTDPGFYKSMIEYFSMRSKEIYDKLIQHGADIIEMGGNIANGSMGEKFFEEFVLEYEKELVDYIHNLNTPVIYHNCGDADKIMHLYNDIGIDAWGYITPPPYGDVDLDKVLKTVKKEMVLIGNIDQIDFLKKSTTSQIRERVKNVLRKVKKRGNFILSTTDWWADDMPDENLKVFVEAGLEFGKY
jgi:uroporphyrinogen decarboxylase